MFKDDNVQEIPLKRTFIDDAAICDLIWKKYVDMLFLVHFNEETRDECGANVR